MTDQEIRDVIQARIDGKPIYYQLYTGGEWQPMLPGAPWMFDRARYEVRERRLELWVNVYPDAIGWAYESKLEADNHDSGNYRLRCVHMIEAP